MQGCGRNSHGSGFDRREASKLTSCCWHAWCALSGVPAEASSSGRSGDPSRRYRYGEGDPHHHAAGVGGDHLRRRDGVARTAPGHRQEGGAYIHPCKRRPGKSYHASLSSPTSGTCIMHGVLQYLLYILKAGAARSRKAATKNGTEIRTDRKRPWCSTLALLSVTNGSTISSRSRNCWMVVRIFRCVTWCAPCFVSHK